MLLCADFDGAWWVRVAYVAWWVWVADAAAAAQPPGKGADLRKRRRLLQQTSALETAAAAEGDHRPVHMPLAMLGGAMLAVRVPAARI